MSALEATTHRVAGPVIELDAVTRRFGHVVALDDVSLTVGEGELVGLLGPNGAGKTTLLSLVNGLRKADSGTVRLFGGDPRAAASRLALGTTPQETGLPSTLRVREVVELVAGHYPSPMPTAEVLDRFGLGDLQRRQTGALSGGQKRRLAVSLALVGRPRLVLLDEPTTGLDVEARHVLWQALRDYHADGATVVLTSHYLEEVEALAHRAVVVGQGRVLADGTLAQILTIVARRRVLLTVPATAQDVTPPPARPPALDGPATEDNAKAVGRYVISLVPYAIATGDLRDWNALAGEPCKYCKNVRDYVVDLHSAGGHGTGGALELGFTSGFDLGGGEFIVGLEYFEAPSQTVAKDGTVTDDTTETASYKANISLVWSGSSWKVKGVQIDPWGESK